MSQSLNFKLKNRLPLILVEITGKISKVKRSSMYTLKFLFVTGVVDRGFIEQGEMLMKLTNSLFSNLFSILLSILLSILVVSFIVKC